MSQERNKRGICDTCIYRSGCLSLKNGIGEGKSIWHCEQFENSMFKKERERRHVFTTFVTFPGFSMKNLIPGWKS
jgi:hypothetical protein